MKLSLRMRKPDSPGQRFLSQMKTWTQGPNILKVVCFDGYLRKCHFQGYIVCSGVGLLSWKRGQVRSMTIEAGSVAEHGVWQGEVERAASS